jgi:periplasmic protein TonB
LYGLSPKSGSNAYQINILLRLILKTQTAMEIKKTSKANLEMKKSFFFQTGLVVSLAIVLAAFEWKTFEKKQFELPASIPILIDEQIEITKPEDPEPEPIKLQPMEFKVSEDDIDQIEIDIDIEIDDFVYTEIVFERPDLNTGNNDDIDDTPFIVVEEMPEFHGGVEALYTYLSNNTKYPTVAKDAGIQGTVHITFVVEKDGSISSAKVLRGIGGGCDEEAMRVVKNMPRWKPGKQRGKEVRVQFNLPVRFVLVNQ